MKSVGIICEYNPFHSGHKYQINKALKYSNADVCIAIMSGNYVQKGEPAIIDKYARTQFAIDNGIDLVIELPTYYSLSSAEIFAKGAVSYLDAINCDYMCFGSESGNINELNDISEILINETDDFKSVLKNAISSGISFPKAREKALSSVVDSKTYINTVNNPNNILGIEYLKAIKSLNSDIKPITIKRYGSNYNEEELNEYYSSATAIRKHLLNDYYDKLSNVLTTSQINVFKSSYMMDFDDFSEMYRYALRRIITDCNSEKAKIIKNLCLYSDVTSDIAGRLYSNYNDYISLSEYALLCKSKNFTLSRIKRCIMHIILNITKDYEQKIRKCIPYIRILGFNKKGQAYLSELKNNTDITIITKIADHKDLYNFEINCSSVYNQAVYNKTGIKLFDEFHQKMIINS